MALVDFGAAAIEQLKAVVKEVLQEEKQQFPGSETQPRFLNTVQGILNEDLEVATNALVEPSTATLSVYVPDGPGPLADFVDAEYDITVTCRLTGIVTIVEGTWMMAIQINGEWVPYVADCSATTIE